MTVEQDAQRYSEMVDKYLELKMQAALRNEHKGIIERGMDDWLMENYFIPVKA